MVRASISQNDCTVCSIFVNPTQFNTHEDYNKYPNTIIQDICQLELAGCSILFLPDVEEIYPEGILSNKKYNLDYLETILEGKFDIVVRGEGENIIKKVQSTFPSDTAVHLERHGCLPLFAIYRFGANIGLLPGVDGPAILGLIDINIPPIKDDY